MTFEFELMFFVVSDIHFKAQQFTAESRVYEKYNSHKLANLSDLSENYVHQTAHITWKDNSSNI